MKKYTKDELDDIRKKRVDRMNWMTRMMIHLGIMRFSIEPRSCGFDYWTCYKLNIWNPLTWFFIVPMFFVSVMIIAPIHAMIKEALNSVNNIVSMAKGERYG